MATTSGSRAACCSELRELIERQNAVDQEDLVVSACKRPLYEPTQLHRHGSFELKADDRSAPSALEHRLEFAHQVLGLLLDLDLGVANDPESTLPFDGIAREEAGDEKRDDLFERDHAGARHSVATWQAHEPLDLVWHADERVHRLAVARARQLQRNGEAEIGNERERMRRIDGERREQRKDLPKEVIFEPRLFFLGHLGAFDQHDAVLGQHLPQLAPALLLVARERSDGVADPSELFGRGEPVRALGRNAGAQLSFEPGNADHEELIEVVGGNRQEPNAFEQRMGLGCRLFEDPPVELQPRQLTIDKSLRARDQIDGCARLDRGQRRGRAGFFLHNNDLAVVSHGRMARMKGAISRSSVTTP